MLISVTEELYQEDCIVSSLPANIALSKTDQMSCALLLKELGVCEKFICFHNRDSAYMSFYGSDLNFHDYRDFEFDTFSLGITNCISSGQAALRLGELIRIESNVSEKNFFSLTGSKRSELLELYAISKCQFFVGGNSGFSNVARAFRKPQLITNLIPFIITGRFGWSGWAARSLILPKKLYKISEQRYLTLAEMTELTYDIHYIGNFFADNGLRIEDNTSEEIANAIIEMSLRIQGTWQDSKIQQKLQERFWSSVSGNGNTRTIQHVLEINISSTFLESSPFLI
jgi:putative glycosyltransferase (TIGR04372 family)